MILMVVLLLLLILFPDGFLLCDHGLDFFRSAYVRIQSIKTVQGFQEVVLRCGVKSEGGGKICSLKLVFSLSRHPISPTDVSS